MPQRDPAIGSDDSVRKLLGGNALQQSTLSGTTTADGYLQHKKSLLLTGKMIVNHSYFKTLIVFFTLMSSLFTAWVCLQWPDFDFWFLIYQGVLVNPVLIMGYIIVWSRFQEYHRDLLKRFKNIMNDQEKAAINKTTRDVAITFAYII